MELDNSASPRRHFSERHDSPPPTRDDSAVSDGLDIHVMSLLPLKNRPSSIFLRPSARLAAREFHGRASIHYTCDTGPRYA